MFRCCCSSMPRKTRPPLSFPQTTCGGPSLLIPPSICHGNKGLFLVVRRENWPKNWIGVKTQPGAGGLLKCPPNRAKWSPITRLTNSAWGGGTYYSSAVRRTQGLGVCCVDFLCISYRVQWNPAQLRRAKRKEPPPADSRV